MKRNVLFFFLSISNKRIHMMFPVILVILFVIWAAEVDRGGGYFGQECFHKSFFQCTVIIGVSWSSECLFDLSGICGEGLFLFQGGQKPTILMLIF